MEEDYDYFADNFTFNPEDDHYCQDCGQDNALLYNCFGQQLTIGGFTSDLFLCDNCHKKRFPNNWRYLKD